MTLELSVLPGGPIIDEGSVVLFPAEVLGGARDGEAIWLAVDHGPASHLLDALTEGFSCPVVAEPWQVYRREVVPVHTDI